jgi:hypothetical protein
MKTLKKYYKDFKFKHPTPNDIKDQRKEFWCKFDYLTDWTQTTNTIGLRNQRSEGKMQIKTTVTLGKNSRMPMPPFVSRIYRWNNGKFYPLRMMSF